VHALQARAVALEDLAGAVDLRDRVSVPAGDRELDPPLQVGGSDTDAQ